MSRCVQHGRGLLHSAPEGRCCRVDFVLGNSICTGCVMYGRQHPLSHERHQQMFHNLVLARSSIRTVLRAGMEQTDKLDVFASISGHACSPVLSCSSLIVAVIVSHARIYWCA